MDEPGCDVGTALTAFVAACEAAPAADDVGCGAAPLREAFRSLQALRDALARQSAAAVPDADVATEQLLQLAENTSVQRPLRNAAYHQLSALARGGAAVAVDAVARGAYHALVADPASAPPYSQLVAELSTRRPQQVAAAAQTLLSVVATGLLVAAEPADEGTDGAPPAADAVSECLLVAHSVLDVLPHGEAANELSSIATAAAELGSNGCAAPEDVECLQELARRAGAPLEEEHPREPAGTAAPAQPAPTGRGKMYSEQEVRQFLAERRRQFETQLRQTTLDLGKVKADQQASETEREEAAAALRDVREQLGRVTAQLEERQIYLREAEEQQNTLEEQNKQLEEQNQELSSYVDELMAMQEGRR